MRTLVRFEKWDEILDGTTLPFYDKPREASWYYWARALANAERGKRQEALEDLNNMDRTLARLKSFSVSSLPSCMSLAQKPRPMLRVRLPILRGLSLSKPTCFTRSRRLTPGQFGNH